MHLPRSSNHCDNHNGIIISHFLILSLAFLPYAASQTIENYCLPSQVDAPTTKALLDKLFLEGNYSAMDRPKEATYATYHLQNDPEVVKVTMTLESVWDINQYSMSFHSKGVWWLTYIDCRLAFRSPLDNGSLEKVVVKAGSGYDIWTPFLANDHMRKTEVDSQKGVWYLHWSGEVTYMQPFNDEVSCYMDFAKIPFDSHRCSFEMRSDEYPGTMVRYALDPMPIDVINEIKFSSWQIKDFSGSLSLAGHGKLVDISHISFSFTLQRQAYFYLTNALGPTFLYWVISYTGFYIDAKHAPARAAIHLLPILILVTQLKSVSDNLPPIAYRTWLNDYILCTLCLVTLHMMAFAHVNFSQSLLESIRKEEEDMKALVHSLDSKSDSILDDPTISKGVQEVNSRFTKKKKLATIGSKGDSYSRVVFLCGFLLFNVIYVPYGVLE